jgi:trimeric autotransporter adhesin
VASEIENHQFRIRTNLPNVKVSWQVTGVRQDVYAKANPLVVEEDKARLRGFYIHPELYGAPAERQIEWARHPQLMKKVQEMRARQQAGARASAPVTRAQPLAR